MMSIMVCTFPKVYVVEDSETVREESSDICLDRLRLA